MNARINAISVEKPSPSAHRDRGVAEEKGDGAPHRGRGCVRERDFSEGGRGWKEGGEKVGSC